MLKLEVVLTFNQNLPLVECRGGIMLVNTPIYSLHMLQFAKKIYVLVSLHMEFTREFHQLKDWF
jgi:hypothetical protein